MLPLSDRNKIKRLQFFKNTKLSLKKNIMPAKRSKRIKVLTFGLFFYLIIALSWWTLLLIVKNNDAKLAKIELLKIVSVAQNQNLSDAQLEQLPAIKQVEEDYTKQKYMIIGEATVFIILLLVGIYQINKSFNREVEAANQQRNFLLSITHELKSPLASIKLILQTFIKRELPEAKVKDFSKDALTETIRLENLVNDLLISARLEQAFQPNFEEIPINLLIEHGLNTLQTKHPNAHINYSGPDEDLMISTDKEGIYAILKNLVENGIKYNNNTHPTIDVCLKKEENITLSIKDDGIGISDNDKTKVFNKFYRIGNEDTRKTKGTGLGLYIVKEFVTALNANVEIQNNEKQGTEFVISFK